MPERLIEGSGQPEVQFLAPVDYLPDEIFVPEDKSWLLYGEPKEAAPLDAHLREMARLALRMYQQLQEVRVERMIKEGNVEEALYYGRATKLVGGVEVYHATKDRWCVKFRTTNIYGEDDPRICGTIMIFDTSPAKLDKYDLEKSGHLVVGRMDGELEVIGTYQEVHDESEGNPTGYLKGLGYADIGEIWPVYMDNFISFTHIY